MLCIFENVVIVPFNIIVVIVKNSRIKWLIKNVTCTIFTFMVTYK